MSNLTNIEKRVRMEVRNAAFEFASGGPASREEFVTSFETDAEQQAANEYIDILIQQGILEQTGQRLIAGMNFEQL